MNNIQFIPSEKKTITEYFCDRTKINNDTRHNFIIKTMHELLLRFPTNYDISQYYPSEISDRQIYDRIITSQEYIKYYNIRNKHKNILKNALNPNVTIISNCCMATFIYSIILQTSYKSPTINSIIPYSMYTKYINNLELYNKIKAKSNYKKSIEKGFSVLQVGDIEVWFVHSTANSVDIERDLWNKRKQRIDYNNLLILTGELHEFPSSEMIQYKNNISSEYNQIYLTRTFENGEHNWFRVNPSNEDNIANIFRLECYDTIIDKLSNGIKNAL